MMKLPIILAAAAVLALGPSALSPCASPAYAAETGACCKTCKKGKACGDSCISRDKECHVGRGCACDG